MHVYTTGTYQISKASCTLLPARVHVRRRPTCPHAPRRVGQVRVHARRCPDQHEQGSREEPTGYAPQPTAEMAVSTRELTLIPVQAVFPSLSASCTRWTLEDWYVHGHVMAARLQLAQCHDQGSRQDTLQGHRTCISTLPPW